MDKCTVKNSKTVLSTSAADPNFVDPGVSSPNYYVGGGIFVGATSLVPIKRSTIDHNSAVFGGGIGGGGQVDIINSTISSNSAKVSGGGLYHVRLDETSDRGRVAYTTVAMNIADQVASLPVGHQHPKGGGIYSEGLLHLGKSILAGNIDKLRTPATVNSIPDDMYSPDCATPGTTQSLISHGDNIIANVGVLEECEH